MTPCLKATFLIRCVQVNSCSITSMTAVHFLHQTDIGLALRKHKAIYSIAPTLFSPSHSLSRSISLSLVYLHFCYANRSAVSSASVVQALLVPSPSQAYLKMSLLLSAATLSFNLTVAFHLRYVSPSPSSSLPLSVFSFAQLFCCRFDHYD